ncbi:hypothetical protein [Catalinimonas niigatensis]|uniref:hypothetical protein n=1 Tax=Catalinimonas niigatensis TaxID=1397264 RepID=UPI002666806E|nr:hypothetical protein [Catalinimonas niigatensis]WPP48673.1 hypothetical protein PZB72_18545 [Catalinimonas niigatensis]
MKNMIWLFVSVFICLSACTTPQMLLKEPLASEALPMPVKGRQGWLINQKLSFGHYQTDRVERGWTFSYGIDVWLTELQGARQKFSFTLQNEKGQKYTVMSAHQLRGLKIPVDRFTPRAKPAVQELLSFTVQTQDMMAATLYDHQQQQYWHMLMMHPDDFRKTGKYVGLLTSGTQSPIQIVPVRKLAGQKSWGGDIVGFEFQQDGQAIAAVELLNQGKVWIDYTLADDMQSLLAAACATLLLQQEIELPSEQI